MNKSFPADFTTWSERRVHQALSFWKSVDEPLQSKWMLYWFKTTDFTTAPLAIVINDTQDAEVEILVLQHHRLTSVIHIWNRENSITEETEWKDPPYCRYKSVCLIAPRHPTLRCLCDVLNVMRCPRMDEALSVSTSSCHLAWFCFPRFSELLFVCLSVFKAALLVWFWPAL